MTIGKPVSLGPNEGDRKTVLGNPFVFKATSADTGGAYVALEFKPEAPLPTHIHANEEEAIYIASGEFEVQLGSETIKASAGSFFVVPRGTVHNLSSTGPGGGKALLIFSPANFGGLFEELDGKTDQDEIMAVASKYGMQVVQG